MSHLYSLVEGSIDTARFEESVRQLLGHKAYVLYTLDKVVQQTLRSLQVLGNDDNFNRLVGVFVYHRTRAAVAEGSDPTSFGGVDAALYQTHVAQAMMYSSEEVYRLQVGIMSKLIIA